MNALFYTRSRCFLPNLVQFKGNLTTSVVNYALIVRGFCQSFLEIDCYQFSLGEIEVLIKLIINRETQTLNISVRDSKPMQTNDILIVQYLIQHERCGYCTGTSLDLQGLALGRSTYGVWTTIKN